MEKLLREHQTLRQQLDSLDESSSQSNETPEYSSHSSEGSTGEYEFTPTWKETQNKKLIQQENNSPHSPNQDNNQSIQVDASSSEDACQGHHKTINEEDVSFHPRNSETLSTNQNKSGDSQNEDTLETEVSDNVDESIPVQIQDRTGILHQQIKNKNKK